MSFMSRAQRATYILIKIAQNNGGTFPLTSIENMSVSYAEQIMKQIKAAGFVKPMRGPGGGYILAKQANEITLGDIYDAVMDNKEDGLGLEVKLDDAFSNAKDASLQVLDETTLSQLI